MKQRTMSLRRVVGGGALLVLLVILALSVTGEIHTWAGLLAVGICNFAYGLESWWTARRRGKGPWWRNSTLALGTGFLLGGVGSVPFPMRV
jgi:hypothetical protein